MTEQEIRDRYKKQHDLLSERYYEKHELSKTEFDHRHGNIWADLESELIAKGFKTPPIPVRDLAVELDQVIIKVRDLEQLIIRVRDLEQLK